MFRSMYASRNLVSTMEKMHSQGEAETFSPFHDYFGLSNLIISDGTLASLDSPSSESSSNFEYPSSPIYKRHRKNSLDLDSVSDSSSSISSRDSEILFESVTVSGDSSTGFPSSSIDVTLAPSYAKTLESIIAHQNTIGRFSNAAVSKESKNSKTSHKANVCVFCRNNGESREFYSSHTLKDNNGSTTCPILRAYTCPLCKANGDGSHTIKYCPKYTPKLKTESNFLGLTLI